MKLISSLFTIKPHNKESLSPIRLFFLSISIVVSPEGVPYITPEDMKDMTYVSRQNQLLFFFFFSLFFCFSSKKKKCRFGEKTRHLKKEQKKKKSFSAIYYHLHRREYDTKARSHALTHAMRKKKTTFRRRDSNPGRPGSLLSLESRT